MASYWPKSLDSVVLPVKSPFSILSEFGEEIYKKSEGKISIRIEGRPTFHEVYLKSEQRSIPFCEVTINQIYPVSVSSTYLDGSLTEQKFIRAANTPNRLEECLQELAELRKYDFVNLLMNAEKTLLMNVQKALSQN